LLTEAEVLGAADTDSVAVDWVADMDLEGEVVGTPSVAVMALADSPGRVDLRRV
jgi:hypothetical protein